MGTRMKVLLTKAVENLGNPGDIKEVAGGYGRNYLIPQGFAVQATRGQVKQAEERMAAGRKREQAARSDASALAARLNGVTLRFVERVGTDSRLYGSVTNADIAQKVQQDLGIELDRRKIDLDDPIKRVGIYPVTVRLLTGLDAVLNVVVDDESGSATTPAPIELPDLPGEDEITPEE